MVQAARAVRMDLAKDTSQIEAKTRFLDSKANRQRLFRQHRPDIPPDPACEALKGGKSVIERYSMHGGSPIHVFQFKLPEQPVRLEPLLIANCIARSYGMSLAGQKRRFDCQPITSGLPLINGHSQG